MMEITVKETGPYLHSSSSIDTDIDYTQYIAEWLRENPFFSDIFNIAGNLAADFQPAIDILAKLRDPAIPDNQMILGNNSMMGFGVPATSLSSNEPYIVMQSLGMFYKSRDASYVFLNYLSYIKSTPFTPIPLWANSLQMPIQDLVGYTPPPPSLQQNPITYNNNKVTYQNANIFYGTVGSNISTGTTGSSDGGTDMSGYFPTTYFDVTYFANDFTVDESVIYDFIIKLKPAHLVFRQFDAIWIAEIDYNLLNPISQIFSYIGTTINAS